MGVLFVFSLGYYYWRFRFPRTGRRDSRLSGPLNSGYESVKIAEECVTVSPCVHTRGGSSAMRSARPNGDVIFTVSGFERRVCYLLCSSVSMLITAAVVRIRRLLSSRELAEYLVLPRPTRGTGCARAVKLRRSFSASSCGRGNVSNGVRPPAVTGSLQ